MLYWLALMRVWRRYFSYSVEGLEHLAGHECRLVVGYHGRPIAWDLFMLGAAVHDRQSYLPLAVVHRSFLKTLYLRWLTEGLVWTTGKGPILAEAIRSGRHIILAPGGEREGLRSASVRYEVDWGEHLGYLRLALRHGLKIVPVGASGVDDTYLGLVDGARLRELLRLPADSSVWLGLGPLGLFPWSPPFPVRIHQIVGAPIDPAAEGAVDPRDTASLMAIHRKIQDQVQALTDRARRHRPPRAAGFDFTSLSPRP